MKNLSFYSITALMTVFTACGGEDSLKLSLPDGNVVMPLQGTPAGSMLSASCCSFWQILNLEKKRGDPVGPCEIVPQR